MELCSTCYTILHCKYLAIGDVDGQGLEKRGDLCLMSSILRSYCPKDVLI